MTKDFGEGRGLFDVSLSIKRGEVYGLVGINGSGKTTLMRHLMGFLRQNSGHASIMNMDCWTCADKPLGKKQIICLRRIFTTRRLIVVAV